MHAPVLNRLIQPKRLWTVREVLDGALQPGDGGGLYVWHFNTVPGGVPTGRCSRQRGYFALYVGIAPSRPSSANTLHGRLRAHCAGDASRSTLRKSLGAVLGMPLRRGANGRFTFGDQEGELTEWMAEHARVSWAFAPTPWIIERTLLAEHDFPLNLAHNRTHPFAARLATLRHAARQA